MLLTELGSDWGLHDLQLAYIQGFTNESNHLKPARVIFASHDQYRVYFPDWKKEVWAKVRGTLPAESEKMAAVGDWVLIEWDGKDHQYAPINFILPRFSVLQRSAKGGHHSEILMTNVNFIGLVTSFNDDLNERRLERGLAMIQDSSAKGFIVLNKSDLVSEVEQSQIKTELKERLGEDVPIFCCSAVHNKGIEDLKAWLKKGSTVSFFGMSGVGKSTLLNSLISAEVMKTSDIREDDARGRHTTTHRELFMTEQGFWLMDTPGIREFSFAGDIESLEQTFEDVTVLIRQCRFSDCEHQTEPGCAVQKALAENVLDEDRWQNFLKLQREARRQEMKTNKAMQSEQKKEWAKRSQGLRQRLKEKGRI